MWAPPELSRVRAVSVTNQPGINVPYWSRGRTPEFARTPMLIKLIPRPCLNAVAGYCVPAARASNGVTLWKSLDDSTGELEFFTRKTPLVAHADMT
jgi:hypothetical protein